MMLKRLIALTLALFIVLLHGAMAEQAENLILNGSFESWDEDGIPTDWYTDAYIRRDGYTAYEASDDAYDGSRSASINNIGSNDARFAQTVEVEPSSLYLLSGRVKVVDMQDGGWGANLSIAGLYASTEGVYDAGDDWQYVEMYGETDEDQYDVTIFVRVGGYSGESTGHALFDDISLVKVQAVPGDGIAEKWFKEEAPVYVAPVEEDDWAEAEEEAGPFWPWLIAISVGYALLALWMLLMANVKPRTLQQKKGMPWWAYVALAASFALRVIIALRVEGYPVDVGCFVSWGNTMAQVGPSAFYQTTSFCDYVPAYLHVMGLSSRLTQLFGEAVNVAFAHKLMPMICDVIGAGLIGWFAARRGMGSRRSGMLAILLALNPAMILNSAAWCQMDSVLCLGLLVVAILAVEKRWAALLPVYVLCILIKPQALMLGPLGLMVLVMELISDRNAWRKMLIGLGISAAVAAVIIVPFAIHQEPGWLIDKYKTTLESYPFATVNTANLYYLFNANWVEIKMPAGALPCYVFAVLSLVWGVIMLLRKDTRNYWWIEPAMMGCFALTFIAMAMVGVSWGALGTVAMAACFAVVLPLCARSGKVRHVPLLGAVLFILLYVLGIKMHERYLFPAVFLLGVAYAIRRDWRVLLLLIVSGTTLFINEGIVLDNAIRLGASLGHLNADTQTLNITLAVLNVACVPLALWCALRTCRLDDSAADDEGLHLPHFDSKPLKVRDYSTDPSLHWKRLDWVLVLAVTLIYSVVSLCNLGSTKAPQTSWRSTTPVETVTIDLGQEYTGFSMLYFCEVSYSNFSVAVSSDKIHWSEETWAEMSEGQCYRWKYVTPSWIMSGGARRFSNPMDVQDVTRFNGRYVRISAQQVGLIMNEVVFRDASGERIEATIVGHEGGSSAATSIGDPALLLDEQETLTGEPSWYNGTYFDEIYHARTAHEHLRGDVPYETSHPPLGKLIMSAFVAIFGMTPFGWRFAGALMGILMLPAMYVLGKQLTKRTDMAFLAMMLMALDCMHFTQTRIATIDSFPVLFIILSYLFMLRFMQRDFIMTPLKKLLPDLALSGFFMGCGIASKWIGVYAGLGLAVLFFWHCLRHQVLGGDACRVLYPSAKGISDDEREVLLMRAKLAFPRMLHVCLWCLLFFVLVPVVIYVLSYIPYFAYLRTNDPLFFLRSIISAQEGMLRYHSTPRLGMDHPFYTPWYEWPFIVKPMYYSDASYVPEGMSYAIFCFGNPAVWLVGLAGLAAVVCTFVKRHAYTREGSVSCLHFAGTHWSVAPAFVLIGLMAQYLPWVLVPRGTYIYHYFASLPFLMLGTMLMMHWFTGRYPRTGRVLMAVYLAVCLAFFIGFYPYASGVTVDVGWLDFMKKFLHVYHN